MFKPGGIPLTFLNAIQLAVLAALVCVAAAFTEATIRYAGDGNTAKAELAARALAGAIDRAIGEIDRDGRLLGAVLQSGAELSVSAKADLLQRWLALQPSFRDAALVSPIGVTMRAGSGAGVVDTVGSWFAPERAGDTLVETRDLPGSPILVAVPIADGAQAERLVVLVGPDWLATLQDGVRRSFALDSAQLTFSVRSAEGSNSTGQNSSVGGRWSTGSARTQGSRGVASPGWTITTYLAQGGGFARLAWAAALVLVAGLCGYGLAGAATRRLRSLSRAGEPDEASAPALRIREFDALETAFSMRAKRMERAREEALSDLSRLRARLGTFETLSGWTCWEIDLVTQRVIWSELSERAREDEPASFAGDHAVDLADLVEGIDPADRPLMRLTMQSALAGDGPHDVSLRACRNGEDGGERRLLVRFRRSGGGSDAASLRLFALSREIAEAQADPVGDPVADRPRPDDASERRRDHAMRSIIDGIVHDMNDVLTVIGANLAVLQRRGVADRESRFLHNALAGTERGAAIARRMVALARRSPGDRAQTDMAGCLSALLPFLQAKILGDLPVMNRVPDDLPNVRCSERILEAVLLNLAFHFRENGFDGLALAARAEEGDGEGEQGFVRLLVASGRPSHRAGTAQAARLAMAARLLEHSGCRLRIIEHGHGTEPFHAEVLMPAQMRRASPPVRHRSSRGLRLLLVEPDTLVRSSIADLLVELGHTVKHSASGEHAESRLSRPHLFDAAIVSHALPVLNGLHLAASLSERHPGLTIIVAGPHGHLPASADRFLQLDKPFRLEDLAAVLSAVEVRTARAA